MNDNDVLAIVIGILNSGLSALPLPGIEVRQSYQPTQQGVPETPAVYIHKISSQRYGFPGRRSVFNPDDGDFDTVESIWVVPTFQVSGLSQQDPTDITQPTASDIVESASDILQSRSTLSTLRESGIGIIRITDVRMLYFVNDKDRHEQEPSFDFVLSYRREFASKTPAVTAIEANIQRV